MILYLGAAGLALWWCYQNTQSMNAGGGAPLPPKNTNDAGQAQPTDPASTGLNNLSGNNSSGFNPGLTA
jgi:hypothetical protein